MASKSKTGERLLSSIQRARKGAGLMPSTPDPVASTSAVGRAAAAPAATLATNTAKPIPKSSPKPNDGPIAKPKAQNTAQPAVAADNAFYGGAFYNGPHIWPD